MPQNKPNLARSFGCLAIVLVLGAMIVLPRACEYYKGRAKLAADVKQEQEFQRKLAAIPDPLRIGATIYTYNSEDQTCPIPVSESFEYADEDMRRQHQMHREKFESLTREYLEQRHEPREPMEARYDEYLEQAVREGHLLLLPEGVKMRIIAKTREGDPPSNKHFPVRDSGWRSSRKTDISSAALLDCTFAMTPKA